MDYKRLENIKDKNEEQLEDNEANKLLSEFKKIDEALDNTELVCTKTDGTKCDFNRFSLPLKFIEKIYNCKITLNCLKNIFILQYLVLWRNDHIK